jgi:hypothetical protein
MGRGAAALFEQVNETRLIFRQFHFLPLRNELHPIAKIILVMALGEGLTWVQAP